MVAQEIKKLADETNILSEIGSIIEEITRKLKTPIRR